MPPPCLRAEIDDLYFNWRAPWTARCRFAGRTGSVLAERNQTQSLACAWEVLKNRWSASTKSCRGTVGARYRSGAVCGAMDLEPAASANQISRRRCRRTLAMPPEATTAPLQRPSFPISSRYSACPLFLAPVCLARGQASQNRLGGLTSIFKLDFSSFFFFLSSLCIAVIQVKITTLPRRSFPPFFFILGPFCSHDLIFAAPVPRSSAVRRAPLTLFPTLPPYLTLRLRTIFAPRFCFRRPHQPNQHHGDWS
jgi:hypothetical protein